MKKQKNKKFWPFLVISILLFGIALLLIPSIQKRLLWQWEITKAYVSGVINPVSAVPTASFTNRSSTPVIQNATPEPPIETPTALPETILPTAMPSPTDAPLPESVILNSPAYEKQDINNCGPATMVMNLRYYGWEGDQFTISDVIKPIAQDRNVNVEELDYYVKELCRLAEHHVSRGWGYRNFKEINRCRFSGHDRRNIYI